MRAGVERSRSAETGAAGVTHIEVRSGVKRVRYGARDGARRQQARVLVGGRPRHRGGARDASDLGHFRLQGAEAPCLRRIGSRAAARADIPARVTPRVARQRRGLCAVGSDENGARRSWPKAVCLGFLRFGGARAAEAAAASAAKAGAERESAPQRCVCRGGLVRAAAGRGACRQDGSAPAVRDKRHCEKRDKLSLTRWWGKGGNPRVSTSKVGYHTN